ncbi:hypothetical protein NJ76_21665 [Rhodococcus sp. IITR03]|nr:hypothetical protein NJ76_21665 [Rhodococcus sp. IITR03]
MQVRSGGLAAVAHRGDLLAGADVLANRDEGLIDVAVDAGRAVVLRDAHPQAEARGRTGFDHDAVGDGDDGRADRVRDVDTVVVGAPTRAEAGRQRSCSGESECGATRSLLAGGLLGGLTGDPLGLCTLCCLLGSDRLGDTLCFPLGGAVQLLGVVRCVDTGDLQHLRCGREVLPGAVHAVADSTRTRSPAAFATVVPPTVTALARTATAIHLPARVARVADRWLLGCGWIQDFGSQQFPLGQALGNERVTIPSQSTSTFDDLSVSP